ncbi:uncharacterized protein LOC122511193 isoform X1 [Leptopilina heterotoma]|uniref:uncharacterized protein LOC122511193 isoform X1 n=1 Tax=Leptopilina heterotoma TaxID=63436 RepID=UPI001CA9B694|nr:uncharacterized protein LOC122511193 isoform X1 [Leptopilina heterotoma]XP_043482237.1 uncharacterized protein LOC122511193 isoform X1 [Leptopilina heterotoma]XP_043482238.1 uncharacterized protein LOC122511193 isoform X1 [Leptopilina heterotoma]
MGGAHLHTPQSVFQHMMGQQNVPQEPEQWLQVPQIPQPSMPWSIPALQQPDLVRFTGESPQPKGFFLHQKRKLVMPDLVDTRPSKQLITEEKMAAHFQQLHISPNSTQTCNQFNSQEDLEMDSTNLIDFEKMKKPQAKLILSEELKRLQEEPIIPSSILSKLERPSMALVLWEPPNKHLRIMHTPRNTPSTPIPNSSDDNNNAMSDEEGNNNNETVHDFNQVRLQNNITSTYEPMDL